MGSSKLYGAGVSVCLFAVCVCSIYVKNWELLEKQKEGKKRMRQIGNVEIPQEAFLAVLKLDD